MSYYKPKGDVSWYAPKATIKSRPFAWSTVAEEEMIVYACEICNGDIDEMIKYLRYGGETERRILTTLRDKYKVSKLFTEDGRIFFSEENMIKSRELRKRYNKYYDYYSEENPESHIWRT